MNIELLKNISVDKDGNIINTITNKPYKKQRNNRYIRLNGSLISLKKVFKEILNQNICFDDI